MRKFYVLLFVAGATWASLILGHPLTGTWLFSATTIPVLTQPQIILLMEIDSAGTAIAKHKFNVPELVSTRSALVFDPSTGDPRLALIGKTSGQLYVNGKVIKSRHKILALAEYDDEDFLAVETGNTIYRVNDLNKKWVFVKPDSLKMADVEVLQRIGPRKIVFMSRFEILVLDFTNPQLPVETFRKKFADLVLKPDSFTEPVAVVGNENGLWLKDKIIPLPAVPPVSNLFYLTFSDARMRRVAAPSYQSMQMLDVDGKTLTIKNDGDVVRIAPDGHFDVHNSAVFTPDSLGLGSISISKIHARRSGFFWNRRLGALEPTALPESPSDMLRNLVADLHSHLGIIPDTNDVPVFKVAQSLNAPTSSAYGPARELVNKSPEILKKFGLRFVAYQFEPESMGAGMSLEQFSHELANNCRQTIVR